jgi:hypothetical protein
MLYKVTFEFDVMVEADTEEEAAQIGATNASSEFHNQSPHDCLAQTSEVKFLDDIPDEWRIDPHAYPYSKRSQPGVTAKSIGAYAAGLPDRYAQMCAALAKKAKTSESK